jgi:SAM-dependent methyltransferase
MDDHFEYVNCLLCGKSDAEVFIRGAGPTQIVKCRNDGLLYMNPRPDISRVRAFHSSFVREDNLELFDRYRRETLRREAAVVKKMRSSGNLLDIGCATGTFFENFQSANWRLYGVETSPLGVKRAISRHKADVFCGTLRDAKYPNEYFDLVTILDTLFYNSDPRSELTEVRRILKNDGLLAVELPGLTYRLLRERGPLCWLLDKKWMRGFTSSYHLYYFSAFAVQSLLESAAFNLIRMVPEPASFSREGIAGKVNNLHLMVTRSLFKLTGGRISIAAKELYLARKKISRDSVGALHEKTHP